MLFFTTDTNCPPEKESRYHKPSNRALSNNGRDAVDTILKKSLFL